MGGGGGVEPKGRRTKILGILEEEVVPKNKYMRTETVAVNGRVKVRHGSQVKKNKESRKTG